MQNQLADRVESKSSLPESSLEKSGNKCLIACPIFRKELESVLGDLNQVPQINYMHYTIHNNPLRMEEELLENVAKVSATGKEVRFLVGKQCNCKREIAEVVEDCGGKIPQARNCIDMLIGDELARKLQKNRTSLMTPAWVRMINQSIAEGQWSVTDARVNLGWYNKILILDTGVDTLSDEEIMEFYDLTQVEIEIQPVDLDHFRTLLQELLQ
jgi:Protein of unknown function (DUF1638)